MTRLLIFICLFSYMSLSHSDNKTVYMTSLQWPPYTGANLGNQGYIIKQTKDIFAGMGYELKVDFYPWARTVALGLDEKSKYVGYFPEYYDVKLEQKCFYSDPIGFSPLGFAQLKSQPIIWGNLNDIADLSRVGVVRDYVNSPDFDARVAKGNIKVDEAVSDVDNIKKLIAKRVPLIVIDQHVLKYLLNHEPDLAQWKDKIEMNHKLLDKKNLYLCFKKNELGQSWLELFNKGLNKEKMKSFIHGSSY